MVGPGVGVAIMTKSLQIEAFRNCMCLTFDYYLVQGTLKVTYWTTQFDLVQVFYRQNGSVLTLRFSRIVKTVLLIILCIFRA